MDYRIPTGLTADAVAHHIQEDLHGIIEPLGSETTVYYDTFNWAIYSTGGLLSQCAGVLEWRSRASDEVCSQPLETEPGFAQALQAGPVQAHIVGACGQRRLLPVMRIKTTTRLLRIVNRNNETVVCLLLDLNRFEDPVSFRAGDLSVRLRVKPTRSFDQEWDAAFTLLKERLGLIASNEPLLLEALAAAGRRPLDDFSKLDVQLDPGQRADATIKQILLALLDTLEVNVEGAQANWDPEFLHDLRVAVRRTRSILGQIKGVFPDQEVAHYQKRFTWLQQVTGSVRDLDVYLLAFDDDRNRLPTLLRPRLAPLYNFLDSHYNTEQQTLATVLGSPPFTALLTQWRAFLTAPVPDSSLLPNAMRPIRSVIEARVLRLAKRVRRQGRAINAKSTPEDLHELRKSCKKLRYLLECFQGLYPASQLRPLIKPLKLLLEQLGDAQDLAVQVAHLEAVAEQMLVEGAATTSTLLAMGALIGDLLARQQIAQIEFIKVFATFDTGRQWQQYKSLFACAEDDAS